MKNGLSKIFNFWGHTINTFDQVVFILKDSGLHDEQGKKINTSKPLTAAQRRSDNFLSFMITVHPYQADTNCKHSRMTCRACVQLLLDVYRIDASINTQMLKNPCDLLVHLADLDNGRNPDIGTLKKEKGDSSEFCKERFKAKFLRCVNGVLFEMVLKTPKGYIFMRNNSHSTSK